MVHSARLALAFALAFALSGCEWVRVRTTTKPTRAKIGGCVCEIGGGIYIFYNKYYLFFLFYLYY